MPERYKVRITDRALADLDSIFQFIHRHSPQNASRMIERILSSIDRLEWLPGRYRIVTRRASQPQQVRSMPVRPYLVRYQIDRARRLVDIVAVKHGARGG